MNRVSERQGQRKNKKGTNMQSHDASTVKRLYKKIKTDLLHVTQILLTTKPLSSKVSTSQSFRGT